MTQGAASDAALVASAPSAAFAEALPLRREHASARDDTGIGVANAFVVVAIVGVFAVWLLRRRGAGARVLGGFGARRAPAAADGLEVLQSTRLTPQATAHVLAWAGGQWLVVCTGSSATVVSRRPGDDAAAPPAQEAP